MRISEQDLTDAAVQCGLTPTQAHGLWLELETKPTIDGRFEPAHVGYFFGALLVIGAMGWFMTRGWDSFRGWQLSIISAGYAAIFLIAGTRLWRHPVLKIVGGLLATMAVCMVPLAVYGIERQLNLWPSADPGSYTRFHPDIHASWVLMEVATVIAGAVALRFFRFAFLTAPMTYAIWYMSMDATALIFGREWRWRDECMISSVLGAIVLLVAYAVDHKMEADFSFWGYLFGLLMFTGGLSALDSGSELAKFGYFSAHIGLVILSLLLRRRVFLIFGSLGVFGYLANEAYTYFRDSVAFPFVLSIIGLLLIFAATQYKKREEYLQTRIRAALAQRVV
ncbi:MAG: hypothetical protein ACRD3E_07065 [Terriglobales bacterium]